MRFRQGQKVRGVHRISLGRIFVVKSLKGSFYTLKDAKTSKTYSAFAKEFDPFFEVLEEKKKNLCSLSGTKNYGEVCSACRFS